MPDSIELTSVVHLMRAIGRTAHNLEELREGIALATPTTLFCHSHQHQLRHPAVDELHPADFVAWVGGVVQDRETTERLSFAIEHHGGSPAELREALLGVLEAIPEKTRVARDAPEEGHFVFLELDSVSVPTQRVAHDPNQLMEHIAATNPSVLFYHLVEQPWLSPDSVSLVDWVREHGDPRLASWLEEAAHSGRPLEEVRRRLIRRWRQSRLGRRLAEVAQAPESARRESGRRTVASLVRRMTRVEDEGDSRPGT